MKEYLVRVIINGRYDEETIQATRVWTTDSGYYCIDMNDGKKRYYPVNKTIVIEL